uniref:Uncharacterized protein n=1 Tax=Rhizophora mucronata TaxID=61149 RepID=A0A2P2QX79_RHIMU
MACSFLDHIRLLTLINAQQTETNSFSVNHVYSTLTLVAMVVGSGRSVCGFHQLVASELSHSD